jgi:hypothetical protein
MPDRVCKDKALNTAFYVILHGGYDERDRGGILQTLRDKDAELSRFREALKQIADGDVAQSSFKGYLDEAYQAIAKAALEGKK